MQFILVHRGDLVVVALAAVLDVVTSVVSKPRPAPQPVPPGLNRQGTYAVEFWPGAAGRVGRLADGVELGVQDDLLGGLAISPVTWSATYLVRLRIRRVNELPIRCLHRN
jgi:hypothetical protein